MPSPSESRAALALVTTAAVSASQRLLAAAEGSPVEQRAMLLEAVPALIGYYSDGSSALAADFYDDEREVAAPRLRFVAEPVVVDRWEKVGRAIAWASEPLMAGLGGTEERLAEVVQLETARPYRDTITTNSKRDPASVGWRRISSGSGCKFCRMLAGKGAIFKQDTARFAAHEHCHCTAQPVFEGQHGEEASVMQYVASKKRRTEADRKRLRDYLASMPD
jgi:hypothetical protein